VICRQDLMPLLSTLPDIAQIRDAGAITVAEFDTYLPLLSLPRVFGTTPAAIPASVPYFDMAALRRRKDMSGLPHLAPSDRPKVGVVWAGSLTHPHDRQRSCALRELLPLLRLPGIAFYSLQKGERRQELAELPSEVHVQDLEPFLHDFGDLAVLLDQLDLVLTVDTAVAHLAGALGKPVWVLLSTVPDWRWGLEGEATPWYPTMRLFRQSWAGDWAEVMQRVVQALAAWPEEKRT
jgi:ADP-heptose:LPS heptosyltransferase